MLTLDDLIDQTPYGQLRYAVPAGGQRAVAGVWSADDDHQSGREDWSDMLAVVSRPLTPLRCAPLVDALVRGGASAIVVPEPAPAALLGHAERRRLPVVVAAPDACSVLYLAQLVSDLRFAGQEVVVERLRHLLDLTQALAGSETAEPLLHWLARAIGGEAILVAPYEAPPALKVEGLILPADRIAAVADGIASSDSDYPVGEWSVRMYGLDPTSPRSVLVVARRGGWPAPISDAVSQAERVLTGWLRQRSRRDSDRAPLRSAVLQMLMAGHVKPARDIALPLMMGTAALQANTVFVFVVSVRAPRRSALTEALQFHLTDKALVAPSTADERYIVVIMADDPMTRELLGDFLDRNPGLYLGASTPLPLGDVSSGYGQAVQALSLAPDAPGRWADYNPLANLASTLPSGPAHQWSKGRLSPLDEWPSDKRILWVETTRLRIAFGTMTAAHRMGVDPNTIRHRANQVASTVGLDWNLLPDRIVLDIALRIQRLRLRTPLLATPTDFAQLLATKEAKKWAQDWIRRFADGLNDHLVDFLFNWIDCNQDTAETASHLDIHPKTVRRRLRSAEEILNRSLVSTSAVKKVAGGTNRASGVHDLILAAHITDSLKSPFLTSSY